MKIACMQFAPDFGKPARNIERIRACAAHTECDILILPELALTGYFFTSQEEIAPLAEPVDGPLARAIAEIAKREGKAVVTGFLESAGGKFYNSALAFDRNGYLAGHYRKVHLFYYETKIFERGNLGFPVFSLAMRFGSAQVGMMICYDWRFPEAARALSLQGSELIAMPSNIVTTTGMLHATLQTRAFENKVVLAFADRVGTERAAQEVLTYRGESAIVGMNGEVLAQASKDSEETIVAEVDLSKTRNKQINQYNDLFADRPESGYGL